MVCAVADPRHVLCCYRSHQMACAVRTTGVLYMIRMLTWACQVSQAKLCHSMPEVPSIITRPIAITLFVGLQGVPRDAVGDLYSPMCTMRARVANASSLPVTRSSKRTPRAISRSACGEHTRQTGRERSVLWGCAQRCDRGQRMPQNEKCTIHQQPNGQKTLLCLQYDNESNWQACRQQGTSQPHCEW